jgi:hypothetical protein
MPNLGSSPLNLSLTSNENTTNGINNYTVLSTNKFTKSIFENTRISFLPTLTKDLSDIHKDDDYDTSVKELVKYTKAYPSMKLRPADFAYLKDIGVYPNNRLIIARRFPNGVSDDLTSLKVTPLSTLISWTPDNNDFFKITYGEKWTSADASFKEILNSVGDDFRAKGLGDSAAGGFGAIPLPGFMEALQLNVFKNLGISDTTLPPVGNPNLIREAQQRLTVDKGKPGSGLMAKVSISMVVEYEQKFINGVDPTLVYYDIIANALSFGTSDSNFQFNNNLNSKISDFITNLTSGTNAGVKAAISQLITAIKDSLSAIANTISAALTKDTTTIDKDGKTEVKDPSKLTDQISSNLLNIAEKSLATIISKYKIQIIGVANAITGSPSTPWHVTIGNPKRPMFSSGDMLVQDVTLTLGKTLSFNDLPSSIRLEFTLTNARSLGSQEIFTKFNTGRGRTYKRIQNPFIDNLNLNEGASGTQSNAE